MKTVEEFISELEGSETLGKEFIAAKGSKALGDFLKKNGCGFTAEDFLASVRPEGELSDDDAAAAAGGGRTPLEDDEEIERYFRYKGWK